MKTFTKDLILLNMLQDVGFIRLKVLLGEFKAPEAIFNAPINRLKAVKGIQQHLVVAWGDHRKPMATLAKEAGIRVTAL